MKDFRKQIKISNMNIAVIEYSNIHKFVLLSEVKKSRPNEFLKGTVKQSISTRTQVKKSNRSLFML